MTTVYVYGYSDPSRWAGFASYQQRIDFLDSQHPNQIEYDQGGPTLDPPYEVDPSLQTLLSSPEFRDKLGRSVKEAILKDQNLTQAFAKFINEGGTIVFTPPDSPNYNQQYAHWVKGLNGDPPYIEMPQSFATPAYGTEARSVFALAHEIYHNEFQMLPGGLTTAQQWGYNEAVASLAAFRMIERIGMTLTTAGMNLIAGNAINIMQNAANDEEAISQLTTWYANNAPANYNTPPSGQ